MTDRGLSAGAIAAYSASEVEFYYLFELGFSTTLYETNAPYTINATGSDASSHNYTSNGLVLNNPKITESLEIKPATIPLVMSGASAALHNLTLSENYRNAEVYIYLYEVSTGETNQIFKGYIDSFKTTEDIAKGISKVTWMLANHWKNWEAESGRHLTHESQTSIVGFENDLGLEFAAISPSISWWGSTSIYAVRSYNGALAESGIYGEYYNLYTAGEPVPLFNSPFFGNTGGIDVYTEGFAAITGNMELGSVKPKLQLAYGQCLTKGVPVFRAISGANNEFLWVVYALAEGECDGLVDIFFDDTSYTDATISPYLPVTNFHAGADSQTVDTDLDADALVPQWTSNHRLQGICYQAIKYTYNEELWGNSLPDPLFEIRGKKLFDPRTSVTAYSLNPALVGYDYVTSTRYGKSIPSTEIAKFNEGATYSETQKTDHDAGLGGTPVSLDLFEFSGLLSTTATIRQNITKILFTMRAHLPYINGKYTLVIERDDDVGTFVIDDTNIKGEFTVTEGSIKNLLNSISYEYVDPGLNYQTEQVVVSSGIYLGLDNNRVLKDSINNKFERNRYRARNRANTILKASRQQLKTVCSMYSFSALKLEPGNIVNLTSTLRGWSAKPNRVESITIDENAIKLELREYEQSVFDWTVLAEETPPPTNTDLTSPFVVDPITTLLLTSGTAALYKNADGTIISRIHATFTAPATVMFSGYIVYIQKTGEAEVLYRAINDITNTDLYIEPVEDGAEYTVSVTAINSLGVESDRVSDVETVVGKSELPVPITTINTGSIDKNVINLFWDENVEVDFSHYEVWGHSIDLLAAAVLIGTTTGYTMNHSVSVKTYYWIRCVDTTGNKSVFYPLVNGVDGTPDGSTNPADWEDLIGKPPDSDLVNTINFVNRFELDDYPLWIIPVTGDLVQSTDAYSGTYAGLFRSSLTAPAPANDEVPSITIPEGVALTFAGKKIRVVVYAKQSLTSPSTSFSILYATNGYGNSGWAGYFSPPVNSGDFATFGFTYNVPVNAGDSLTDRLEIWGDTSGSGGGVLIDNVVIDILSSWSDVSGDSNAPADNADVTQYDDQRVSNSSEDLIILTVANPIGGKFKGSPLETGAIVITLPQSWTSTMMKFIVDVFLYRDAADPDGRDSFTISLGGYNFTGGDWQREFAQISGDTSSNNKVRFGYDGTNCVIVIGDETDYWDYPIIVCKSFQASFSNYTLDQWKDDWSVDVELIETHATKTFTFTGELADALLDAKSILGQGALAIQDSVTYDTQVDGGPPTNADATDYTDYRVSNSDLSDQVLTIASPVGAHKGYNTSPTGSIVITLPQAWTGTMLKFVIDVYQHSDVGGVAKSFSVAVGGFNNTSLTTWQKAFAQIFGNISSNNSVRFGYDPVAAKCVVCVGDDTETWTFPQISVRDFQAGYGNYSLSQWETGWSVAVVADTSGYTNIITIPDALLDAHSILNQGLLAKEDEVDYATYVVDGPPINADVTTAVRIGVKINYSDFTTPLAGDAYFHGFDAEGLASDAAGVFPYIGLNGTNLPLSKGTLDPGMVCEGYVVYRDTGWGATSDKYAIGVPNGSATFVWTMYYGGVQYTAAVLDGDDYVIGFGRTSTGSATISSIQLWGYGIKANMALGYYSDVTDYEDYRVSNSVAENSVLKIANPVGGTYSNNSAISGAIVITLPKGWSGTMMKFVIDVFLLSDSSTSFQLYVGGYNNSILSRWDNEFAQLTGSATSNNRVRFGINASGKCVIFIGDTVTDGTASTWNWPKISVRDFQGGYDNYLFTDWDDNWTISVVNTTSGYTFTGDISDALIDAASILNQGVLATENETNFYDNSKYYYFTNFESLDGFYKTGTYSILSANGNLTITGNVSTASLVFKYLGGVERQLIWNKTRRIKAVIKMNGASNMTAPEVIQFRSGRYSTARIGIHAVWNSTQSQIQIYLYANAGLTHMAYINDNTEHKFEVVHTPGVSVKGYMDDTLYVTNTTQVPSGTTHDPNVFEIGFDQPTPASVNITVSEVEVEIGE